MADQIEVISRYSFWEIVGLLTAIIIVFGIISTFLKKVYSDLETWRTKKNSIEDEKEGVEKRIAALEANDKSFDDKLDTIAAGVQQVAAGLETFSESVNKRLDSINNEMHERAIIQNRSHLYRLHKQFMDQGEVTLAEREMFDLVSRDYLECGGNSIFKSKIIPEVESLPIRD
jgi:DNA repair exonuclease SbcCD ATPase subunit